MDDQGASRRTRPYGVSPNGHQLPPETRLGPVRLQVADLQRSLDYYGRLLGPEVLEEDGGHAKLLAGGGTEPLVELHERPGAAPVPRGGRLGLFHFAILLPGRRHLGWFAEHLTRIDEPFAASDHRVSEALYLWDPDGLGVEVYADRPRSSWKRQGRQLIVATDPLDLGAVIRAGGEGSWAGVPEGTRIGHLHLHVGDLERAERFYHQGLGLDKVVWSYPGALFLSAGGYHHHLAVNTWARGAPPPEENEARLLEWELRLPSPGAVEAVRVSLEEAGHSVEREGDGVRVADPWGTYLRVRCDGPVDPESRGR